MVNLNIKMLFSFMYNVDVYFENVMTAKIILTNVVLILHVYP